MTADGFGEPRKTPRVPNPIRFASAFWKSLNGGRCRKPGSFGARGIPSPVDKSPWPSVRFVVIKNSLFFLRA
jgi:hypothetical protein